MIIGALSAATGRYLLARATGLLRNRLSQKVTKNLDGAAELLTKQARNKYLSILLFGLSPFPSAQLFEAAGLIRLKLTPLISAFFLGRIVNYAIAVAGATTLKSIGVSDLIKEAVKSPWSIAFQIAMLYGLYLLMKVDWRKYLRSK